MPESILDRVAEAKAVVPTVSPQELEPMLGRDDVLVVDVRDHPEVAESGRVAGALHVTRGMLEFRADPATPYHFEEFRKDRTIVVYCASGGRSALGAKALLDLGYRDVRNLGAFGDWVNAGGPVEGGAREPGASGPGATCRVAEASGARVPAASRPRTSGT